MPSYYPVYLDLRGRRCLIIGGGAEAERKSQGLVECGAQVTVISPKVNIALQDMANRGLIDWVSREYQAGDLEGVFLAVAENDKPNVYMQVAKEAERRGVLLNVVDTTNLCSFIAPAIVRRGCHIRHIHLRSQPRSGAPAQRGAERKPCATLGGYGRYGRGGPPGLAAQGGTARPGAMAGVHGRGIAGAVPRRTP